MKIALFGATGHLGSQVLRQALEQGHEVSVLVRRPEKLISSHPQLTVHVGDVLSPGDVGTVVEGREAVVSALGESLQGPFEVLTQGLSNLLGAMTSSGVERIVATASAGVLQYDATSLRRDQPDFPPMFTKVSEAHLQAFRLLEDSKVSWTLLCPPYMPEGAPTGQYRILADYGPEGGVQISTGDAAHFILGELGRSAFVGRRVGIAY